MADQVEAAGATTTAAAPAAPDAASKGEEGKVGREGPVKAHSKHKDDAQESISRCLVYCRLRPKNKTDYKSGGYQLVTAENNRIVLKDECNYNFDGAFNENTTQEEIFETVAVPCINHAFNGFCSALMCYGQTGTGKSFTMCNTTPGQEGIIPRAAKLIFEKVNSDSQRKYEIVAQFVQIYRDHLGDLMVGNGKDRVDIRFDDVEGVELTGCTSHVLHNAQEFMRFYHNGNERRVVTATAMNPESSRGHTALIIRVISEQADDPASGKIKGKITFIDLAGYERFSKTGITNDNPIMKDEAKCINASLLSLGHVVSALSSGGRHIPWRNSKLTRILQDSIGGRSRTSIILTVGPSSDHLHETTNSLQFGLRAMAVKVVARQSVSVDYEKLARKLQTLLDEKDERINLLEVQIASREAERQELKEMYERRRMEVDARFESDMAHLESIGASEEQVQKLREVYRVEVENLQEQQNEEIEYQEEAHSKEISKLIQEQERQEAKRRAEMKLAQERIIEEFQSKLDKAREGTNDDLVKALQELAQKDALLASRANDTVRLHEHIEVLTEQIKELGGVPVQEAVFPETFLDVGQVEEIQERLEAEVRREHAKAVELRAQLDRLSITCAERVEEINKLQDENNRLRQYLTKHGVEVSDTDEVTEFLRSKRSRMVDSSELETLQITMQADIDELKASKAELEREVESLKLERSQNYVPLTARIRGTARGTARGLPPLYPGLNTGRSTHGSRQNNVRSDDTGSNSGFSQVENTPRAIRQLSDQLAFSMREKSALQERVRTLEAAIASQGGDAPEPYIPPIKLDIPGVVSSSSPSSPSPLTGNMDGKLGETVQETDMDVLLKVKDDEIDSFLETIERQEYLLTTARSNDEFYQRVLTELHQQMAAANLEIPEHNNIPPPVDSIAMDDYMSILRTVRDAERRLTSIILGREDTNTQDVENILDEKDKELQLKEELIIEKASKAQYVAKLCIRLKKQMERIGVTPCCQLPDSYKDLIEQEQGELEDQMEFQQGIEEQLQSEAEERLRLANTLESLNKERERQAAVLRSTELRCKNAEMRELCAAETVQRITKEKSQKERHLEEALRALTRELMDLQVKLAKAEEVERAGALGSLLRRLHFRK